MALPRFTWGELDSETFTQRLSHAYSTVVHWRRNIFSIPSGNAGTAFVTELSRLFCAYAVGSALESVALKAAMTMCALLLQKPSRSSKAKDHVACLERRMATCKAEDLNELLEEGLTIQRGLLTAKPKQCCEDEKVQRAFMSEMSKGNTRAALHSLSKENKGLHLADSVPAANGEYTSVLDILRSKHPVGSMPSEVAMVEGAQNPPLALLQRMLKIRWLLKTSQLVFYNHLIFNIRCNKAKLTTLSLHIQPSIRTVQGYRIVEQASKKFLQERIHLTHFRRSTLKSLKDCPDIVVLHTDKGNTTVVVDTKDYEQKISELLEDSVYKKISKDPTATWERKVMNELKKLSDESLIEPGLCDRLRPTASRPPKFYGLPKIHKPDISLRPIVLCIRSPTFNLAKYVTRSISPLCGKNTFIC